MATHPQREYDDFARALLDVEEGRISPLNINKFADELRQSLRELNEGKVFEIDRKDPEKSIRQILKKVS